MQDCAGDAALAHAQLLKDAREHDAHGRLGGALAARREYLDAQDIRVDDVNHL